MVDRCVDTSVAAIGNGFVKFKLTKIKSALVG